jgi:hypothetical protein
MTASRPRTIRSLMTASGITVACDYDRTHTDRNATAMVDRGPTVGKVPACDECAAVHARETCSDKSLWPTAAIIGEAARHGLNVDAADVAPSGVHGHTIDGRPWWQWLDDMNQD